MLALCAAILSTVLGTAASVGMNKLRSKYMRAAMNTVTNLPMVNPEIITGEANEHDKAIIDRYHARSAHKRRDPLRYHGE